MILRIVGLLAAAGAIALTAVLVLGGGNGYQVRVNLPDADGLRPGSRVEVGGVPVGTVSSLQITPQDHALATISFDKADTPIGTDASVVIRPADLLGEKYLDLSVGNRADPARSGYEIPAAHTADATDLDQILDVLAPTTRDRVAILIHETGVALFGRGADLKATLNALPPSVTDAQALIQQVTASNANLQGLLTHAGRVIATVSANDPTLGRFVSTAGAALAATAEHQQQLEATIAQAPGTLQALRTTLQRLDLAGAALRPAAAGLVKTAPGLTATLQALPGFTRAALPTLAEVRDISPQLIRLGEGASPVVAQLSTTGRSLATLSTQSAPFVTALDSSTANLLGTLQNWARAIQTEDGLSHEFRVSTELAPDLITDLKPVIDGASASTPALGSAAPAPSARATPSPAPASAAAPVQSTTTTPAAVPPATPTVPTVAAPVVKTVQGLLGYLLGK